MKNVTLILAMILFSSCVTSKVTAGELESSTNEEPNWFVRAPRIVLPRIPAGDFPPISFHSPPEVTKCLSGKHEIRTCLHDLARKADIGSECCAAIKKMKEDCKNTVYGSYNKPFWAGYFRLHCTTDVVGSTSPLLLHRLRDFNYLLESSSYETAVNRFCDCTRNVNGYSRYTPITYDINRLIMSVSSEVQKSKVLDNNVYA
ncbi:Uncharacterized protein Rs2_32713 [Raphanus sativus]|nr:Uncharacterized protein Rs2_32713 [Raphanus sativus]